MSQVVLEGNDSDHNLGNVGSGTGFSSLSLAEIVPGIW